MTSSIIDCRGMVLRNLRYGDTSRVATLFTGELGKVSVIAKGVRTPKSPFGASLEILTVGSYVLYFRTGRDLQFLRSGSVEREFTGIIRNPARYVYGCALLEFLDRMLLEEEPAGRLFQVCLRALERIESEPVGGLPELFRAFQLRCAAILGYAPMLEACLHCGRPLEASSTARPGDETAWLFRPSEGGALCPECSGETSEGYPMTIRALLRVRAMAVGGGTVAVAAPPGGPAGPLARDPAVPAEGRRPAGWVREPAPGAVARPLDHSDPGGAGSPPAGASGGEAPPARPPADAEVWIRSLDRLVEEFLRFHVERYRGLRSLEQRGGFREGPVEDSRR